MEEDRGAAPKRPLAILEIYLPADKPGGSYSFDYPGYRVNVDVVPGHRSIVNVRDLVENARGHYDAVALSGFSLTYTVGDKYHRHIALRGLLAEDEDAPMYVCDGIRAKDTVERWLMRRITEQLEGEIVNRRILVLTGIDRWGVSEVISGLGSPVIFGDLMYNFRFGIPLFSLNQVKLAAPLVLKVATRAPLDWYFPGARRFSRMLPRWRPAFYWAEVIAGGMTYLRRYSPASLEGKVAVTNIRSYEDVLWLRSKGVSLIASLTPVVSGNRVSASVIEAVMTIATKGRSGHRRDRYLDEIIKLDLQPEIISFGPSAPQVSAVDARALADAAPIPFGAKAPAFVFESHKDTAKFAFVIHPLVASQLRRHPVLRKFKAFLSEGAMEAIAARSPSFIGSHATGIVSKTGKRAEGWIVVLPITPKLMLRMPPEQVYDRLVELAEMGQDIGATVMGLGAFTSVVGDAGASVARRSPIAITTGNSYTVAATIDTIKKASALIGIDIGRSTAMVIGATGSIGSVLARLLAEKVSEIVLVSPRPERLIGLGKQIAGEAPGVALTSSTNVSDHIHRADIIVATTSAIEPIVSVERLKPGALVCDVARPPDIKEESAKKRPDVLVIESGEIALPSEANIGFDIGLPPNTVYACLAETIILALEGVATHYTIGRTIEKEKVIEVAAMGEKHGFALAGLRSFGQPVTDEQIEFVRKARQGGRSG